MNERAQDITRLLLKNLQGKASSDEQAQLKAWSNASEKKAELFRELSSVEAAATLLAQRYSYNHEKIDHALQQAFPNVDFGINSTKTTKITHRVHFLKTAWFRWAAAVIILFGIGTYIFTHTSQPNKEVVQTTPSPINDILPGSDRAVLTLSSGQQVQLDNTSAETIKDGQLDIRHNNGQLSYKNAEIAAINTMTTPRGGQYQLTLADGTKVWLNAASSITFPTAFKSSTREVSITGEAYFEVAKNKEKPFIVKTQKEIITVLGTSFNVNAYPEENIKTSLVEGSVKINSSILKPGQAYSGGKISKTDITQDIAWKNGAFSFKNIDFENAMRQLARWYDVNIIYDNGVLPTSKLNGEMDRNLTLKDALAGLDGLGARFKLQNKTVHVIAIIK